jgi:hypothetical protein
MSQNRRFTITAAEQQIQQQMENLPVPQQNQQMLRQNTLASTVSTLKIRSKISPP